MLRLKKYFCLVLLFVGFSGNTRAARTDCAATVRELLQSGSDLSVKEMKKRLSNSNFYTPNVQKAYALYSNEFANSKTWAEIFPEASVLEVFSGFEGSIRAEEFGDLLGLIKAARKTRMSRSSARELVEKIATEFLDIRAPKDQIATRIENFLKDSSAENLRRLAGEKTLEESRLLLFGGNPLKPTEESLLGRYLSETKASSIKRGFPMSASEESKMGPQKFTVAIDRGKSSELFDKYFMQPEFFYHMHTPQQGTLHFLHHGKEGSYSRYASTFSANRPGEGTLLPMIIMSSKEAERMRLYFSLGVINQDLAKMPWEYTDYCATGGYDSCTHWFGEMPIGEDLVASYRFPGNVDRHAGNAPSSRPQTKTLGPLNFNREQIYRYGYSAPTGNVKIFPWASSRKTKASSLDLAEALAGAVWKAPGHMQMWEVLGQKTALDQGEFANPGYVARVLTGKVSNDRVPVVFVYAEDASEKLEKNFNTQISAY